MKNLHGKTLLLTRAAGDNRAWCAAVRAAGGQAIELPCIHIEAIRDAGTRARLLDAIDGCHWLVLTSRRGVSAVCELHPDPVPSSLRVAAVGDVTARACRERLGRCDLVPATQTASSLASELLRAVATNGDPDGTRVVAATADDAPRHLEACLVPCGVSVTRVPVYRTRPAAPVDPKRELSGLGLDAILLASPQAVRGLVNQARIPRGVDIVTIGPATSEAARALGLAVAAEARRPALDALLECIS